MPSLRSFPQQSTVEYRRVGPERCTTLLSVFVHVSVQRVIPDDFDRGNVQPSSNENLRERNFGEHDGSKPV
jgi:hypothetical protein